MLLHEADRQWIMRPRDRIELWSGDELALGDSLLLVNLGGHFPGGTVCLWTHGPAGAGALLSGDIVQVVPDREWASFMWSYPNLIPLPPREVARIRDRSAEMSFYRVIGAWWECIMDGDARTKVLAIRRPLHQRTSVAIGGRENERDAALLRQRHAGLRARCAARGG